MLAKSSFTSFSWNVAAKKRAKSTGWNGTRIATVGTVAVEEYTTPTGKTRWRFLYRKPQEKEWRRKTIAGCTSREAATAAASKLNESFYLHQHHGQPLKETVLLRELLTRHRDRCSQRRRPVYQGHVKRISDYFGTETDAATITVEQVEKFKAHLTEQTAYHGRPLSPYTVSGILRFLRGALEYAVQEGQLDRNPTRLVKPPRFNNARERLWSATEFYKVLNTLGKRYRPAMILARHTGIRLNALCQLEWKQVELEGEHPHIRLRAEQTKTNRPRTVPLNSKAQDLLHGLEHDDSYVFPWTRRVKEPARILSTLISRAIKKCKIEDLRAHDLRHTWATARYIETGYNIVAVRNEGGWTNLMHLNRYLNMTEADKERAIRMLEIDVQSMT